MLNSPDRQHDESADDELHIEAECELRFEPAQVDERQLPSVQDVIRRDEDRKEVARPQARTDSKYRAVRDPVAPNGHWRNYLNVPRSEEHTSELQSLMRISYAVFCLTKKIT